jgi:hypothetical protein
MVISTSLLTLKSVLDLGPVTVSELVCVAQEDNVGLFAEEFGFLGCIRKGHFIVRVAILTNLVLDNVRSTHVERHIFLGFLDSLPDLIRIVEGVDLLEEHDGISLNLLR